MDYHTLIACAEQAGCTVTPDVPLSALTSFHIGGPADLLIDMPASAAAAVIACCHKEGIPRFLLGNGTNLLAGDKGFRGAILRITDDPDSPVLREDGVISCTAGVPLKRLCLFARDAGLTGLEFAFGIPGSVGGAVYMDAGAYGGEIADVIDSADCLMPDGIAVTLTKEDLALGYRHSALMDNGAVVLRAYFRLTPGDRGTIADTMKELMGRRRDKQPLEYPSAGSFFKRPTGYFAGALIEQAGLKGYTVGGAQISEKHAGFVINRGGATAADVCKLCADVQQKIWETAGVRLEPEVRKIGDF